MLPVQTNRNLSQNYIMSPNSYIKGVTASAAKQSIKKLEYALCGLLRHYVPRNDYLTLDT